MDTAQWVWRSEVADQWTVSALERLVAGPALTREDLAHVREALGAVATETRRLRSVLGYCPRPIAVLDMSGGIAGYNLEFARHFGGAVVMGQSIASRLDEPDRTLFENVLASTARDGRAGALVTMREPDGQQKEVEFLVATLPGRARGPLGLVMAAEDRRQELEQGAARLAGAAAVSCANVSTALSMTEMVISHDVGNALTVASVSIEALAARRSRGESLDDPEVDAALTSAVESIRQAGTILKDLRKGAQPRGVVAEEDANVRASADVAVNLVEPLARRGCVAIALDIESSFRARITPSALNQVLTNLLTNALQAIGEARQAGAVRVWAERTPGPAAMLAIHVSDNGVGVEPRRLAAIFEPGETTRAEQGGLGFGLAISRHVVESVGGTLRAATAVGLGTDVIVQLVDRSGPDVLARAE